MANRVVPRASARIRERLTELGIDYLTRRVPLEKDQRHALRRATGSDTIPALQAGYDTVLIGGRAIRRFLDQQIVEPAEASPT